MNKLNIMIPICFSIAVLSPACQVGLSGGQRMPLRPGSTPTPTPGGYEAPAAPRPSATPFIPTGTPSPRPQPSPSPSPDTLALQGLDPYFHHTYCESLQDSLATAHQRPFQDLVVSADGKTLYLTQQRTLQAIASQEPHTLQRPEPAIHRLNYFDHGEAKISRQILFTLNTETDQLHPVNLPAEQINTCHLNAEIEKDDAGQVILSETVFNTQSQAYVPITGHRFYRFNPLNHQLVAERQIALREPDPSPSAGADANILRNLTKVPSQSDYYYTLESPAHNFHNVRSLIQQLPSSGEAETLIHSEGMGGPRPFAILPNTHVFYQGYQVSAPYPSYAGSSQVTAEQWQALPEENHAQIQEVLKSLQAPTNENTPFYRLAPTGETLYISLSNMHQIWALNLDNLQLRPLAGQGSPGNQDGQGADARFDKPGAIDVDANGHLYVLDQNNQSIRKITPTGQVSTLYTTPAATP